MLKILRSLVECEDGHEIKEVTHSKILDKFLKCDNIHEYIKWTPIFSKIVKPLKYESSKVVQSSMKKKQRSRSLPKFAIILVRVLNLTKLIL